LLIPAAYAYVETAARVALLTQTIQHDVDCLPDTISLPNPPFDALTSFEYRIEDDPYVAVPVANYEIVPSSPRTLIRRVYGQTYPSGGCLISRVVYTAGYGTRWGDIPIQARQAIAMLVCRWELHREGLSNEKEVPQAVTPLIRQLKDWGSLHGCKEIYQDRRIEARPIVTTTEV
jgi:uncharacterized phiE125 gp8 family phage protein